MLLDRRDGQAHDVRYLGQGITLDTTQDEGAFRLWRQRLDHALEPPEFIARRQHAFVRDAALQVLDVRHQVERHDHLATLPIDQDVAGDARHEREAVADVAPVIRGESPRQRLGDNVLDFVTVV